MSQDPHGQPPAPEPRFQGQNQYQNPYQGQGASQQPYGGYPPAQGYPNPDRTEGAKNAQLSLIFGIVGLFILGIILGPLAIVYAGKAERAGVPATGGKVLGWIVTILSALGVLAFILFVAVGAGMSSY